MSECRVSNKPGNPQAQRSQSKDPAIRELFNIMGEFFTVKAGSRTRAWEPDDEADP